MCCSITVLHVTHGELEKKNSRQLIAGSQVTKDVHPLAPAPPPHPDELVSPPPLPWDQHFSVDQVPTTIDDVVEVFREVKRRYRNGKTNLALRES